MDEDISPLELCDGCWEMYPLPHVRCRDASCECPLCNLELDVNRQLREWAREN